MNINKDTLLYGSFSSNPGNNGCIFFFNNAFEKYKKFDIIHIDPWFHHNMDFRKSINETIDNIKFINHFNEDCLFEIGTEESIYYFDDTMLKNMLKILKSKLGDLFNKIVYCTIQSGTMLKGIKNTGEYDPVRLSKIIKICNDYELLTKEHNGDYINIEIIKEKIQNGLSAINIAPEFGVYETEVLLDNMTEEQKENFFNICYKSNKWYKWVDKDFDPFQNKTELMKICGHYQFSTKEFKSMNINFDNIIKEKLYKKIKKLTQL